MQTDELLLIDLSGLAHQIWHVSGNEPDPSFVSTQVIARVRALAAAHPYAAVCCDDGKSFRADLDPTYKANRDTENRAPLRHQMDVACETLKNDGFPIWRVKGYEADDVIATAVKEATAIDGASVLVVSSDKDLLQLVSDRVRVKSIITSDIVGPAEVFDKWGVKPSQIADLLALMGDKSDNIVGADKIGKVIGARLLSEHGSLAALYDKMAVGVVDGVTPGMRTSLMAFKPRWPLVASLIALRTDAPIPFTEIASERVAAPMVEETPMAEPFKQGDDSNDAPLPAGWMQPTLSRPVSEATSDTPSIPNGVASGRASNDTTTTTSVSPHLPPSDVVASVPNAGGSGQLAPYAPPPAPVDFGQQLEPRNMQEAKQLAQMMYDSRLFSAYGTPQAVLATVLAGRELGLPAMSSLRGFHIIEGKPQMSAGMIQSLVLKSGKATYFRCSERTPLRATFVTKRGDDPEMVLTYTIEEGRAAFVGDDAKWAKSGWGRNPADMLVARASSKLARLVYPDVVSGLYAPEEND
jgi:5'-3' exonuclease